MTQVQMNNVYNLIKDWLVGKSIEVWDATKPVKFSGVVDKIQWKEGGKKPLRIHFKDGQICETDIFNPILFKK